MSIGWHLGFVLVSAAVAIATMKKLNNTNKVRTRSRRINLYLSVTIVCGLIFLLTYMSYKGHFGSVMDWFGERSQFVNEAASQADLGGVQESSAPAGGSDTFFGIMFDAGSTGSRIHVFKIRHDTKGGAYDVLDEFFLATKPGLSSYAENPTEAANSLKGMLAKAKDFIPQSQWSSTPLALKATAGLRLLSNKTAKAILDEVLTLFRTYPFKSSVESVSILEGKEEGLFCWFTLNFLQGVLQRLDDAVGIMDLGGGSTQITYLPTPGVVHTGAAPAGFLIDVKVFGEKLNIYTHSYLGLGINSMRFQTIGAKESPDHFRSGSFRSVCLPDKYSGTWKYGGREHNVSSESLNGSQSRFDRCYSAVKTIVNSYKIDKPRDLLQKRFYALSYFYDRAVDVKLIDSAVGGQVKVQDYIDAAKKECQASTSEDPFMCLDLCYISSLLTDGYGFSLTSTLLLQKKVKNVEITWSLGALFSYYGQFNTL